MAQKKPTARNDQKLKVFLIRNVLEEKLDVRSVPEEELDVIKTLALGLGDEEEAEEEGENSEASKQPEGPGLGHSGHKTGQQGGQQERERDREKEQEQELLADLEKNCVTRKVRVQLKVVEMEEARDLT